MIRCYIVDDEKPAIAVLKRHIKRMPHLLLLGAETNPVKAIAVILREKPELVFLDIQMHEMDGLDVMKIIGPQTKVIFCTAYSEYAASSYELEAIDYLVKPIGFDRFVKAVQKVVNLLQLEEKKETSPDYIYIKGDMRGKYRRVDFADIDYIRARNNYVGLYNGEKQILSYQTLKEMDELLPADKFMRIHKSYIVSLDKIAEIDNNVIILKSRVRLTVSSGYRSTFMTKMRRS